MDKSTKIIILIVASTVAFLVLLVFAWQVLLANPEATQDYLLPEESKQNNSQDQSQSQNKPPLIQRRAN